MTAQDSSKGVGSDVPQYIIDKILLLKNLEHILGHLPTEVFEVKDLKEKVDSQTSAFQSSQQEQQTELLFGDICDELQALEKSPQDISEIINHYLFYTGGPKYCNEQEVKEVLGL